MTAATPDRPRTKVYLASSWRNDRQPFLVNHLRSRGLDVYDFRHPEGPGDDYHFHWREIDPMWQSWDAQTFRGALEHPMAERGFQVDMDALNACDWVVLLMPAGNSSHLELGWGVGAGKKTAIILEDGRPELMLKMVDVIVTNDAELEALITLMLDDNPLTDLMLKGDL